MFAIWNKWISLSLYKYTPLYFPSLIFHCSLCIYILLITKLYMYLQCIQCISTSFSLILFLLFLLVLISIFPTFPALDCGPPPVLVNGNVATQNGTLVGSSAVYACNYKYAFAVSSSTERTCSSSGNWSTEKIECGGFGKIKCFIPDYVYFHSSILIKRW